MDSSRLAHDTSATFSPNHKRGSQAATIGKSDLGRFGLKLNPYHLGRRQDLNARAGNRGSQGGPGPAVFQHVSQGFALGSRGNF